MAETNGHHPQPDPVTLVTQLTRDLQELKLLREASALERYLVVVVPMAGPPSVREFVSREEQIKAMRGWLDEEGWLIPLVGRQEFLSGLDDVAFLVAADGQRIRLRDVGPQVVEPVARTGPGRRVAEDKLPDDRPAEIPAPVADPAPSA